MPTHEPLDDYLARAYAAVRQTSGGAIAAFCDSLQRARERRRTIFVCGNGGSAANAAHFAQDLGKSTLNRDEYDRTDIPRFRVVSLSDSPAYLLTWANDESFERVFVEQLKNLAEPEDILIAISGSGNSPNILAATQWANAHGVETWGVTGFDGGMLLAIARHAIHVPVNDMGLVESAHLLLFHWVFRELHRRLHKTD